ncbi:MAG: ABC transporter permease [Tepidisphaeraceae bacterium]
MSMLYRKDLRLLFPIFLTAVGFWVVLLAFGGIAYLMSDRPRPTSDLMTLLSAISAACLSSSAVVAPALGGAGFSLERQSGWSDFLATLPVSRGRWIGAKLAASATIFLALMLPPIASFLFFDGLARSSPLSWSNDLNVILTMLSSAIGGFGIAWLASTWLNSAVYASIIGIALVIGVYAALAAWYHLTMPTVRPSGMPMNGVAALLGLFATAIGCSRQSRRLEP